MDLLTVFMLQYMKVNLLLVFFAFISRQTRLLASRMCFCRPINYRRQHDDDYKR